MADIYMEEFKKRLTKGLIGGGAFALLMVLSPLYMGESVFLGMPWYLVPVLLTVTILYGTGWAFAFNLIKRVLRNFSRGVEDASIWQLFTSNGFVIGFVYAMLFLCIGSFAAFILGNIFMAVDFWNALKGKAPISGEYKFDGDKNIDREKEIIDKIRAGSKLNDIASAASAERIEENKRNLDNIENGESGDIKVTVDGEEKNIHIN